MRTSCVKSSTSAEQSRALINSFYTHTKGTMNTVGEKDTNLKSGLKELCELRVEPTKDGNMFLSSPPLGEGLHAVCPDLAQAGLRQ